MQDTDEGVRVRGVVLRVPQLAEAARSYADLGFDLDSGKVPFLVRARFPSHSELDYGPVFLGWLDEDDYRMMDVSGVRRRR